MTRKKERWPSRRRRRWQTKTTTTKAFLAAASAPHRGWLFVALRRVDIALNFHLTARTIAQKSNAFAREREATSPLFQSMPSCLLFFSLFLSLFLSFLAPDTHSFPLN